MVDIRGRDLVYYAPMTTKKVVYGERSERMSAAKNILEKAGEARVLDISGRTSNGAAKVPAGRDRAMPGKMSVKFLSIAVAASCTLVLRAANLPVPVSSEVGTGFWMENFSRATNLAHQASAPMVLFWGNEGCTYCGYLEQAVNTSAFKEWMKLHPDYIYCYVQGVKGKDVAPNEKADVKQFAKTAAGTLSAGKALSQYPFICLYWPKPDGKVKVSSFEGRTGSMLVSASGRTLAQEFEDSIEKVFSSYVARSEVTFRCGEGDGTLGLENRTDRLEAEPSTKHVDVPFARKGGTASQSRNALVVEWPDGIRPTATNYVEWAVLATNSYAVVDTTVPEGKAFPSGKRLKLTLLDSSGKACASNSITFVDAKPNSCTNPYWVGERTANTLGFTEWTHDYNIVRKKVSSGKADYVLALFSGTLWCPYCNGIEESLLKSQEFREWCESNRVQVALFDQPQLPANGGGSQLLTYLAGVEHIAGVDPVSGASYLSRHSIREDDASAVRIRAAVTRYSQSKWLTPETTSVRLSNPTVLLIGPNDNVLGRFKAWRDRNQEFGHELGNKFYDPAENIARLDDLLKLAGRPDESQDYASTTTNVLELGSSAVSAFQINDAVDHYLVRPAGRGKARFKISAKTARKTVRLAFLRDGVETAYSTNGVLDVEISRVELSAKRLVLRVSAPDLQDSTVRVGAGSSFDATVASTFKPTTRDEAVLYTDLSSKATLSGYVVADGQTVTVKVTSGKLPKGVSLKWDAATSSVVVSGTPSKAGSSTFTYQVKIIAPNGKTVSSEKTKAKVTVASASVLNPYYGRAIVASVPLYKSDVWGAKTLESFIRVAQTTKNKLTAKRFAGESTSFSGQWAKVDPETGLLTATLKKGKEKVVLKLGSDGALSATFSGNKGKVSVATDYRRFAGRYTVTLPVTETTAWYYTFGTGYLTLKTSTLTARKGLVAYAGALPNGVAVSGSAYLGGDPKDQAYALLPIYARSSRKLSNGVKKYTAKDDLAAVLRIRCDGKSTYDDEEQNRIVLSPMGVNAFWQRQTSALDNSLVATMSVYGGYFVTGKKIGDWLALFGLGKESGLVATVDGVEVPAVWKFSPTTGVITGTAKAVIDRRTVTASFKGVVLPGWIDCGCGDELPVRPFASGTFFYSSTVNGCSTPSSLAFDLHAP